MLVDVWIQFCFRIPPQYIDTYDEFIEKEAQKFLGTYNGKYITKIEKIVKSTPEVMADSMGTMRCDCNIKVQIKLFLKGEVKFLRIAVKS